MCQNNALHCAENGGHCLWNWIHLRVFIVFHFFYSFLKGSGNSDIQPKVRDELPPQKKRLYMDDAISKTSKSIVWNDTENVKNGSYFLDIFRIRQVQLSTDFDKWHDFVFSIDWSMWHYLRFPRVRVWFEFDIKWKGNFRKCNSFWHNLFVTFMGLFSWYKRPTCCYFTNIICGLYFISMRVICTEFLFIHSFSISQRIFVSSKL